MSKDLEVIVSCQVMALLVLLGEIDISICYAFVMQYIL